MVLLRQAVVALSVEALLFWLNKPTELIIVVAYDNPYIGTGNLYTPPENVGVGHWCIDCLVYRFLSSRSRESIHSTSFCVLRKLVYRLRGV